MNPIGGVAQWLGRWNIPAPLENVFTATNKEGPTAILPLEVSTTVGRSVSSARRSGFLEFQERFLEEVAVAIVWLYGVGFMSRRFNQIKKALFPKLNHLNLETAWDFKLKDKYKSVDLSPAERFTRNALERRHLVNLKFLGLIFSVGIGTMTAALLIPWLNKKKTEAIIAYLDKQEAQKSKTWQELPLNGKQFPRHPERIPESLYYHAAKLPATQKPFVQNQNAPAPLRFGMASGVSDLVQKLGHGIQQSNYGELLAVDGVLTGGRVKVYGDRSPFEAWEIAVRDLGSIYFYMYSAPHVMWLASKAISPLVGADPTLEPKVARLAQQAILRQVLSEERAAGRLSPDVLKLLEHADPETLNALPDKLMTKKPGHLGVPESAISKALRGIEVTPGQIRAAIAGLNLTDQRAYLEALEQGWRSASKERFLDRFAQEARVYGVSDAPIKDYLNTRIGASKLISTDAVASLLGDIHKGEADAFAGLSPTARMDLQTAVKQAFRHTAGERFAMASIGQQPQLLHLANALPSSDTALYWERARQMAGQDARDLANSSFRRCLNLGLAYSQKTGDRQVAQAGEAMADWLERAIVKHRSLGDILDESLSNFAGDLKKQKPAAVAHNLEKLASQLISGDPAQVVEALSTLEQGLETQKDSLVQRTKNAFAGRNGLRQQLEALSDILKPPARLLASSQAPPAQTLDAFAGDNMRTYLEGVARSARQSGALEPSAQALFDTYASDFSRLLGGEEGRLFSLSVSGAREPIEKKLRALAAGGIQSDERLLSDGLEVAGRLKAHSRLFNSPKANERLARQLNVWSQQLLSKFGNQPITAETLLHQLENYRRVSQSGHMIARAFAMGISMLGLGLIIPKLQYALTKKLTGKNEHPGLATLHHSDVHTDSWKFRSS